MPVLADITYDPGADFAVQRQYLLLFALGWWDDTLLITPGNPSVYQEVVFGGYRCVVKFKEWFWAWDNRSIVLSDLFEDLYALEPGGGTPINLGDVLIQYKVEPAYRAPTIVIALDSPDNFYWLQRFPAATRPYWKPQYDGAPPTPFSVDGTP